MQLLEYKAMRHILTNYFIQAQGITTTQQKQYRVAFGWLVTLRIYIQHLTFMLRVTHEPVMDIMQIWKKRISRQFRPCCTSCLQIVVYQTRRRKTKNELEAEYYIQVRRRKCKAQSNNCYLSTADNLMHAILLSLRHKKHTRIVAAVLSSASGKSRTNTNFSNC